MTREQIIEKQIEEVMDEFDFRKVAEYMKSVEWVWHSTDGVPSESDLRKSVRKTMRDLSNKGEHGYYSGGFDIRFYENKDDKWLRFDVKFVLESWAMDGENYKTTP